MGCGCSDDKPKVIDKVKSIAVGWSNILWSTPEVKEMAYCRISVCAECDQNIRNLCLKCGCWIPAKARSPDEKCYKWDK